MYIKLKSLVYIVILISVIRHQCICVAAGWVARLLERITLHSCLNVFMLKNSNLATMFPIRIKLYYNRSNNFSSVSRMNKVML